MAGLFVLIAASTIAVSHAFLTPHNIAVHEPKKSSCLRSSHVSRAGSHSIVMHGEERNVCRRDHEQIYLARRQLIKTVGVGGLLLGTKKKSLAFEYKQQRLGDAAFSVSSLWTSTASPERGVYFSDPVTGQAFRFLDIVVTNTDADSVDDFGRVETVNFAKTLGLRPELARADMIAASLRQGDGQLFYEWDLAMAPKECPGTQYLVGSCPYDQIVLLSTTVRNGKTYTLELVADAAQWQRNGVALRAIRESFRTQ